MSEKEESTIGSINADQHHSEFEGRDGVATNVPEDPTLAAPMSMKSRKRRKVSHNDSDTEDTPTQCTTTSTVAMSGTAMSYTNTNTTSSSGINNTTTTSPSACMSCHVSDIDRLTLCRRPLPNAHACVNPASPAVDSLFYQPQQPNPMFAHLKSSFTASNGALRFSSTTIPTSPAPFFLDARISNSSVPAEIASILSGASFDFSEYVLHVRREERGELESETLVLELDLVSTDIDPLEPLVGY
jgi:hypothetical protein